jgi:uncharacterized membrane protein
MSDVLVRARHNQRWRAASSKARLAVVVLVFVVVGAATAASGAWPAAAPAGWAAAAAAFDVWTWLAIAPLDADETRTHAKRFDPSAPLMDTLILSAAVVSLATVVELLVAASSVKGLAAAALACAALLLVGLSWLVVHTTFTLRYARLYYQSESGDISFNQDDPPQYTDFAYLAFTVGMTFQVSDTDIQGHRIRSTILRHMLLSYLFGAIILATVINLLASLSAGGG